MLLHTPYHAIPWANINFTNETIYVQRKSDGGGDSGGGDGYRENVNCTYIGPDSILKM